MNKKTAQKRAQNIPVERHRLTFQCLRLIRGETSSEVARKAGVCYQTVVNMRKTIEAGGTLCPRISVIDKIGRAYGMKLQFVEMGAPKSASKYSIREERASAASFN